MSYEIFIDIETLGIRETAYPLSIALVAFDFNQKPIFADLEQDKEKQLFIKFSLEDLSKYKAFTKDPSTVEWWKKQPEKAKKLNLIPHKNDVTLTKGLHLIHKFFEEFYTMNSSHVWSRGIDFDLPKFKYMHDVGGRSYPFNPRRGRDCRTFIDVLCGTDNGFYESPVMYPPEEHGLIKHFPLHDALYDVYSMLEIVHGEGTPF